MKMRMRMRTRKCEWWNTLMSLPSLTDQMWRFLSKLPEAMNSPSGEKATLYTGSLNNTELRKTSESNRKKESVGRLEEKKAGVPQTNEH